MSALAVVRQLASVVVAPSSSSDVMLLKLVFWAGLLGSAARVVAAALDWDRAANALPSLFDVLWVYWLLDTTRQRDQARAELAQHRLEGPRDA
ncbi:hypothetical protein [Sphaerisporangium sp. NPDC051011]|uniref:hypothetical protein n=1 Tax=Sphaerisporangium sp. NPDC051011 TaxID=3155792 RepID=UPI00340E79CD